MGHTLAVPKKEVDYIFDLDDDTLAGLQLFSKKVAGAIRKSFPCDRVGIAVIGLEVAHTHVHLVPINSIDDLNFTRRKLKPSQEELASAAEKIRRNM